MLKRIFLLIMMSFFFFLGGCDEYALLEQYQLDVDLMRLPAPQNFTVSGSTGNPNSIMISWEYSIAEIDGFRIMRSENGGVFTEIMNESQLSSSARNYENIGLNGGTTYTYRMYAVADGFQSRPTPELSSVSNPP